ncbi:hypothetical protein [Dyadobacter sp. CY356]|uniref:hypothetical protein n=1 Tax=Dyadobacter sp. CY356 TaxID=2906442 RepID=UPI001F446DEA|nr:hypothetical protein [Dyadobacter sp. CY356]MCF0057483.1 hypothetical protein [Dyadobacter sp. CY356]
MRIFTICFFLIYLIAGNTYGQIAVLQPSVPDNVPAYPLSLYRSATKDAQNLYNGRVYYIYDSREDEHQFFNDRKYENGAVFYDGQRYDSIPMMYDIVKDELVIKHINGFEPIVLQSPKVSFFTIYDHSYINLKSGKDITPDMQTGFYDVVYNGKTKTLARRIKQRQEKIVERKVIAMFPQKNFFYIYSNGKFNSVHTRKSVTKLFPGQKAELRKALREQNIKFRKDRERAIVTMVARYDELTKQ